MPSHNHFPLSIRELKDLYAGNESKTHRIQVPDHQRFYVWKYPRQSALIQSILSGFPFHSFIFSECTTRLGGYDIEDGQQRIQTLHLFLNNQFAVELEENGALVYRYYNHPELPSLSVEQRARFDYTPLYVIAVRNCTDDDIATIFERLNAGKPLSDADKFFNRKDSPLVKFAIDTLLTPGTTFTERAKKVFRDHMTAYTSKNRGGLTQAVGLIAACMYGRDDPKLITTSYERLYRAIMRPISPEQEEVCLANLDKLLSLYETVDATIGYSDTHVPSARDPSKKVPVKAQKKYKEQWKLGKFSAYYLYNLFTAEEDPTVDWVRYLVECRSSSTHSPEQHLKSAGAQNLTPLKLQAGIYKFEQWSVGLLEDVDELIDDTESDNESFD